MNILKAHGKLLLSAEYMVMHGAAALAVPLLRGQQLERIRSQNRKVFSWKAFYEEQPWFRADIDPSNLRILDSDDPEKAERLRELIAACIELMPSFQQELFRWDVETRLDFSPQWGFGSSSTLIALMAEWVEVNPLDLHFMVSEGSGYDVACAIADGPIQYRLRDGSPHYRHIPFQPPFADRLYFAWLGTKQATSAHLKEVRLKPGFETIHHFSELTRRMIECREAETFGKLMDEHEERLSRFLGMEMVSAQRLAGLPGHVKSLGAWGGDFVMILSGTGEKELFEYLQRKDIRVIFRYNELVYDRTNVQQ